jgi:predicted short-subunit dehydrogenase-like oxidoreductase (DUF2520 family)
VTFDHVAVIGPGRVGLSFARALLRAGESIAVLGRDAQAIPEPLEPASPVWDAALTACDLVIVAVPDDAIGAVALELARSRLITADHAVLHTSGLCDRSSLAALNGSGAALGSIHPLQTFVDSDGDPDALAGAPAVIEGDPRAVAVARRVAALVRLTPVVEIDAEKKPLYHAAAVFASNYPVVLAAIAARLGREAGLGDIADTLFHPLMRRTISNLEGGAAAALTGPIRRGDAGTVSRHLEMLAGNDRALYLALGREALAIAVRAGLDPSRADAVWRVLVDDPGTERGLAAKE